MGNRLQIPDVSNSRKTTPEHIAAVSRFWIDRYEVTVGRFRAAVERGLVAKSPSIVVNDGPLGTKGNDPATSLCTWSSTPMGREDFALSCVIWRLAREYCRSVGGDLPSEAQWEYAASTAARPFTTLYPGGNATPACGAAALERLAPGCTLPDGTSAPFGPAAVTAFDGTTGGPGDVTSLGIVNLAGGVAEWMRDSAQTYDGAYWSAAPVVDPVCEEADAPNHVIKGGSWSSAARPSFVRYPLASGRGGIDVLGLDPPLPDMGFRCVYGGPP
jgi:formylglycine-generating enzyme required for sulfatase activity